MHWDNVLESFTHSSKWRKESIMRHNYRYAHTVHEHARLCSTIVGNKKYAPIALAIPSIMHVGTYVWTSHSLQSLYLIAMDQSTTQRSSSLVTNAVLCNTEWMRQQNHRGLRIVSWNNHIFNYRMDAAITMQYNAKLIKHTYMYIQILSWTN